ncbi:hypothetical protein EU245_02845 [Lentibacillus lipolyticus]|nr:hypothetical protein EU245_02845 [Lentibacillus lipolyticus]
MDNWFKSPWFVRAISLAFAIALYVFVQVEMDQYQNESRLLPNTNADIQTIENVPVNIRINEEKYVVSGVPEFAAVSLEGTTGTLTATARNQNFDIYVDLEGLKPGTHTVELKHTGVPKELNVYIEPKTIEVTIEQRASRDFAIAVDYINQDKLPEGYQIDSSQTEPKQVTITSSKEIIDQIAIVKAFVDVAGVEETIDSREVPVKVYDARGNELNAHVEPPSVNVSVQISNPSKTVPVSVATAGELPDGYSLTSISANMDEVKVFATSETLQNIEEISTKKIDLADITESGTINVGLALPDGANVPGKDAVEVTVELEQSKIFKNVPISTENLPDGQDVTFIDPESPEMNLTVTGSQSKVSEISKDDLSITLDAAGLGNGEHEVSVSVDGPGDVDINSEFEQVAIEIS